MDKDKIVSKEISFSSGKVLTAEMLQELQDFPRLLAQAEYEGYGDGILCGMELKEAGDGTELELSPVILKLDGRIYSSPHSLKLPADNPGERLQSPWYAWVLRPQPPEESRGVRSYRLQQHIVASENVQPQDLVLLQVPRNVGRLRLPRLSQDEKCFGEFTKANICKVILGNHSCFGGNTYMPVVFAAVREYLEAKQDKCLQDYALLMELQNHPVVSGACVRGYIREAGLQVAEDEAMEAIFPEFVKALQMKRKAYLPPAGAKPEPQTQVAEKPKKQESFAEF